MFLDQLVAYEIAELQDATCPVEMIRIDVPEDDPDFKPNITNTKFMPFVRSGYNKQTGNSPNNPRRPVCCLQVTNVVSMLTKHKTTLVRGFSWCWVHRLTALQTQWRIFMQFINVSCGRTCKKWPSCHPMWPKFIFFIIIIY